MDDEELEDEEVAKRAAAIDIDHPIVNHFECRIEQEITIGEEEVDFANILVIFNDMFLYLGAYKGQTLDKTRRTFETRIRKKANKTAIKHTFF
jgi:hypothetical protein